MIKFNKQRELMRKLGLIIIWVFLVTGCMTKSRWVNNPISDFTYSYEEEYKDTLIEVVKLELKRDKEPLTTRQGMTISLNGLSSPAIRGYITFLMVIIH